MELLEPWMPAGDMAPSLESELALEVGTQHPLTGRRMKANAARKDRDDVLYVSVDDATLIAVVYLTYSQHPEPDGRWPTAVFFSSFQDWAERGMQPDHKEYCG